MSHTFRRVMIGAAAVTLLAGTGALAANRGYLGGGSSIAEPQGVTAESVCGWRAGGTPSESPVRLSSGGDLVLPVGGAVPYRVHLTNGEEHAVDIPAGSAPVLVATLGVKAVVAGYAPASFAPEPRTLPAGEVLEHRAFDAFVACPGQPTAEDGVHLAPGTYEMHSAQALGWKTSGRAAPFNTWARFGGITITDPLARGGSQAAAPSAPAGTCGAPLDALPQGSTHVATFDELDPVLAVAGTPFQPGVRVTNGGERTITDAVQGGPVLLVAKDGAVIARSESIDALPGPSLGAGQSFEFGTFAALTDCTTDKPLLPGVYEYAVAQQAHNPEAIAPFGAVARGGALAVTTMTGAVRTEVALPELPVCEESVTDFAFDGPSAAKVAYAGRTARDLASGAILRDVPDGEVTVELELPYSGPERAMHLGGHRAVLARDGVVVATSEQQLSNTSPSTWPTGSTQLASFPTWNDCTGTSIEPEGDYTVLGFVDHVYVDEWGLPAHHVTTLAPTAVTFASP